MCPGFNSCLVPYGGWVSCWFSPCTEGSSPGLPFLLPPQKTNIFNLIPIQAGWRSRKKTSFFLMRLSLYIMCFLTLAPTSGLRWRGHTEASKKSAFSSRIKSVTSRFRNPSEVVSRFWQPCRHFRDTQCFTRLNNETFWRQKLRQIYASFRGEFGPLNWLITALVLFFSL